MNMKKGNNSIVMTPQLYYSCSSDAALSTPSPNRNDIVYALDNGLKIRTLDGMLYNI